MKKIYFKFLFLKHRALQVLGLKDADDFTIKIWQDGDTQDTCLFAYGRSGLLYLPVGRKCEEGKEYYSHWIASLRHMAKYGLINKEKNMTIYTLMEIKERK